MRILLTGSTGFIGTAFLRQANASGHKVAALIRPTPGRQRAFPHTHLSLYGTLEDAPWQEIGKFAPEVCVHTAWVATPDVYLDSPENESFVFWSQDFLRRAMDRGVETVLTLGTCVEYAMTGAALSEAKTPTAPSSPYARAKDALRQWQETEAAKRGARAIWARVFYPYGPGEHRSRLTSSLIAKLRKGEPVYLKTPRSTKDYIYVDDLTSGMLAVLERHPTGCVNLGTGDGVTIETVARELGRMLGRPELIQSPKSTYDDPLNYVVADAAQLRALGWQPNVTLTEGLRRLVQAHGL